MDGQPREGFTGWFKDLFKGVLGAVLVTLILTLFQYLGAHLSDLIHFTTEIAGATTSIRLFKR